MSYTCWKYRNKASDGNASLDNAKKRLEDYETEINKVLNGVQNNFPNDNSFCEGVEILISRIKIAINNCTSAINTMKTTSYTKATRLDDDETERRRREQEGK